MPGMPSKQQVIWAFEEKSLRGTKLPIDAGHWRIEVFESCIWTFYMHVFF